MTNMEALNEHMIGQGQHPIFDTDTQSILESIGNRLDQSTIVYGIPYQERSSRAATLHKRSVTHLTL